MTRIPVSLVFTACAGLFTTIIPAFPITDSEAESIVAAEIAAEIDRRSERRDHLMDVPATRETVHQTTEGAIVVRQVAPPERVVNPVATDEPEPASEQTTKMPAPEDAAKPEISLTLFVNATNDGSEIRARVGGNETEYTVLSRAIRHLPGIFTVETPDARYHFFAIVTQTDAKPATPQDGADYQIKSDGTPVPESFESAIAALHEHALQHQSEWIAGLERARSLEAARRRHRAQNPPEPRVTTLNVWRAPPAPANSPDVSDR